MASIQNHIKEEPNSPKKGIILDMAMAKLLFGKESPNEIIAQGNSYIFFYFIYLKLFKII